MPGRRGYDSGMEPLWMPRTNSAARALGAAFLAAGAAVLYWQGWLPLAAAQRGDAAVTYSLKLLVLGELFVVFGGLWLIRGLAGYAAVRGLKERGTFAVVALAVIGVALALGSMWFMSAALQQLGYAG